MSGESWRKMSVNYKDSKQPHIEEESKYIKKKKKNKTKKSDHKHEYIPAIYYRTETNFKGEKRQIINYGTHCKICGKIDEMSYMFFHIEERLKEFKKKYPDYVEITLPDSWNFFKNKNIPL